MNRKSIIWLSLAGAAVVAVLAVAWSLIFSPTKVAFVNYQAINLGQIARANDNSFIKISELPVEELDKAGKYDMVFVNGMGLRITAEQREALAKAADKGTPVLTTAATNPENLIVSLDSVDSEFVRQYLSAGGRRNYRSMLGYVRKYIDGKKAFCGEIADPEASASGLLYHPAVAGKDRDELQFYSVAEYQRWMESRGIDHAARPGVILAGAMGVPDSLVAALERSGCAVYPVNNIQAFIRNGHADSISTSAMVNMAHGRMGDMVTAFLKERNIPLFSTVNANRLYDEWMADKMGMNGGFLSQSIVTPEIDGAIRPFTLFAHFEGKDGLPYADAILGRLDDFVATVNNYISLREKPNSEKKLAIVYFKGPGQNALVAEGMDVSRSLYNFLVRLRSEGYRVDGLPASAAAFEKVIAEQGRVFGSYAVGAQADFVRDRHPEIIKKGDYSGWALRSFGAEMLDEINALDGPFPGHGLSTPAGDLALARVRFGNVVLIPQTAAGTGSDDFKMVHGTDMAPPHNYVAAYLWARHGFKADALMHFGAHGSLEFTPRKQAALGSRDWPDRLVGTMPHFYVYSTSNVGEAMMAKRRSYATILNYLTPPFMESDVRGIYKNLSDALADYNRVAAAEHPSESAVAHAASLVKKYTVEMGIHRELRLDSVMTTPYAADDIARIENFAEELANEKITGALYVMGVPYAPEHIRSTVYAMTVDPVAYSLFSLDRTRGKVSGDPDKNRGEFTRRYLVPARALVSGLLTSGAAATDADICRVAGVSQEELAKAREVHEALEDSKDLFSKMMVMGSSMPASKPTARLSARPAKSGGMGGMMSMPGMTPEKALAMAKKMGADEKALAKMEAAMKKGGKGNNKAGASPHGANPHKGMGGAMAAMMSRPDYTKAEIDKAAAIMEVERALSNISAYCDALVNSPEAEMAGILNGLDGGFVAPTSGGDPVLNPDILPTGRNMFAVNAEETPSAVAWEKGKALAENTIALYRKNHNDSLPRKVSYTLWSSEFIETEGATIAQVLYMLGVEPVRDPFGRVTDLRLIPASELGRPRIDVVVQTSGQFRDLAASRLFLIDRAVKMAAAAKDGEAPNYVAEGVVEAERTLVEKGVTPKEARELSTARVFGGVNGNYGSGIQEMVEAGDRWDDASQVAQTYINNMGAYYGSEEDWERVRQYAFEAALTRTDAVVQPRQSNTWGALSLDHVYEFMGGMNLAVKEVTGKDPEAYLSDYRNRNNARMQDVKEAIGVESRTTILNPHYIKEKMKGGAGDASGIADVVRNTYGWNVMKPSVIDKELWDDIYDTYVKDVNNLGTREFFTSQNPAALEEITAVMLETARKGMWQASAEQLQTLAELHTETVNRYKPSCSGFVCDNAKLRDFISEKVSPEAARDYAASIGEIRAEKVAGGSDGTVMKKETTSILEKATSSVNGLAVTGAVVLVLLTFFIIKRRRNGRDQNLA